jgi:hypothetical protein
VVPDPAAVLVEPPGRGSVVHAEVEHATQPPQVAGVADLHEQFHPAVQVPVHHVGAADEDLAVLVLTGAERVDAGVLKETTEHAADPDVLGQALDAGPQRADAAHPQVNRHAVPRGTVERVDHHLVDQRVGLEHDPGGQAGPAPLGLPVDAADDADPH